MSATPDRSDPRVERSRRVICRAALAELAEVGFGRFTIESVAARAGVGKSTIYRHWPDRVAVVVDALRADHERLVPAAETGSERDHVLKLVRHVASILLDPTISACLRALVEPAAHDSRLRESLRHFTDARGRELVDAIARASAAGEVREGLAPESGADLLLGPLFHRALLTGDPILPSQVDHLVHLVLDDAGA